MYLDAVTIIIPFYSQPLMLAHQLENFARYDRHVRDRFTVIVVDDGSPEPASDVIGKDDGIHLYRILEDIPWNRGMARNLGARVAETDWIIQVDTDHTLQPICAAELFFVDVDPKCWYRFPRVRIGVADETRKKDAIPDDVSFGVIKPHIDSYLCTKKLYWAAGGYDEDYSGCLGGGSPFLKNLENEGELKHLPTQVHLCVHTRHSIPDASECHLDRDRTEFKRRWKAKGLVKAKNPLRYPWEQIF